MFTIHVVGKDLIGGHLCPTKRGSKRRCILGWIADSQYCEPDTPVMQRARKILGMENLQSIYAPHDTYISQHYSQHNEDRLDGIKVLHPDARPGYIELMRSLGIDVVFDEEEKKEVITSVIEEEILQEVCV